MVDVAAMSDKEDVSFSGSKGRRAVGHWTKIKWTKKVIEVEKTRKTRKVVN